MIICFFDLLGARILARSEVSLQTLTIDMVFHGVLSIRGREGKMVLDLKTHPLVVGITEGYHSFISISSQLGTLYLCH